MRQEFRDLSPEEKQKRLQAGTALLKQIGDLIDEFREFCRMGFGDLESDQALHEINRLITSLRAKVAIGKATKLIRMDEVPEIFEIEKIIFQTYKRLGVECSDQANTN